MASSAYYNLPEDMANGNLIPGTHTFKVLLTTSSYTPDKTHSKRSHITNEVSGTGYTAGGKEITITVSRASGVTSLTLSTVTWDAPVSGFTARWAVVYRARGGAASADELVGYLDGGGTVTANGLLFQFTPTAPITLTVP